MLNRRFLRARLKTAAEKTADRLVDLRNAIFMPGWRRQARAKKDQLTKDYIVITGSSGKSTAARLIGVIVEPQRSIGTGMFYNTERMVLRHMRFWTRHVDIFVQELSEYPPGTIAAVSETMKPRGALITSIGYDHRSTFKTLQSIADEMIPLVNQLPSNGFICLNADDPTVRSLAASVTAARVILYGRAKDADIRVENISSSIVSRLAFDLIEGETRRRVQTQFVGTLLLPSIVGALALVHALELDLDQAIAQLTSARPLETRMGVFKGTDGHTYVLDTYKSSFWSTQLLIKDMPNISEGSRVIIINDVTNMGGDSSKRYRQLLRLASETCTTVIATGSAANPAEVLVRNEPQRSNVMVARDADEVDTILRGLPPSVVVIKGRAFKPKFAGLRAS